MNKKNILIVGDWLIDEHWVTSIDRSPTSRRTGNSHYRVLHKPDGIIQLTSGAGRTASVLHQTKYSNRKHFCKIIGVGLWHENDDDAMTNMLNSSEADDQEESEGQKETEEETLLKIQTLHQLTHDYSATMPPSLENKPSLINIYDKSEKNNQGTTRIIRIYQRIDRKMELIERIDWELNVPDNGKYWITDAGKAKKYVGKIEKKLGEHKIDAVIIKDFHKGVVSTELIKELARVYKGKDIPWFIYTKAWKPDWLDKLGDINVRLLFIPPVAAEAALRKGDLISWVSRSGKISAESFNVLDDLNKEFQGDDRRIITLLPNKSTVFLRDNKDKDRIIGRLINNAAPPSLQVPVDIASTLFSSLTVNLLANKSLESDELLKDCLGYTQTWMKREADRVLEPENKKYQKEISISLAKKTIKPWGIEAVNTNIEIEKLVWDDCKQEWKDALLLKSFRKVADKPGNAATPDKTNKRKNKNKKIQLWRAMTQVDGYAHIVKSKIKVIRELMNGLESFKLAHGKSKSYMIVAPPGSGKTSLIKSLVKACGFGYLSFNVTQMMSKSDLLDCFETIVTTQAANRKKPLLVFVDEIRDQIDGRNVYPAFLSPLEEGVYVRGGRTFYIDPCFWIFADTKIPEQRENSENKSKDFLSRLSMPPLIIESLVDKTKQSSGINDNIRVENIYLGVCLICALFPDVQRISEKVLETFGFLPIDITGRRLRKFVESFYDIKDGCVIANKNIPIEKWPKDKINSIESAKEQWMKWDKDRKERVNKKDPEKLKDVEDLNRIEMYVFAGIVWKSWGETAKENLAEKRWKKMNEIEGIIFIEKVWGTWSEKMRDDKIEEARKTWARGKPDELAKKRWEEMKEIEKLVFVEKEWATWPERDLVEIEK